MKTSIYLGAILSAALSVGANAATLDPTAIFSLRSSTNEAGPATLMDASWGDGGFDGFLVSDTLFGRSDHSQAEFDMSAISGPVVSATLEWRLGLGLASDTIFIDSYISDGIASLTDWTPQNSSLVGTTTAAPGPQSLDITSLINASLGLDHLGISFSIDAHPDAAYFWGNPIQINYELAAVPIPAAAWLFGSALLGLVGIGRNRKKV